MTQNEQKAQSTSAAQASASPARTNARHKRPSPGASTETVGEDPLYFVKFDAMRCALCHDDRERWYAFLHRLVMFFSGLSSAGAVALFLKDYPTAATITGLAVTALTTLDLVFDLSGKTRLHAGLKEQFYVVLSECEGDRIGDPKPHRTRLTKLYGAEPPLPNALNYLMWNKAYLALACEPDDAELYQIGWWWKFTRHVLSHEGKIFVTKGVKNGGKEGSEKGSEENSSEEDGARKRDDCKT